MLEQKLVTLNPTVVAPKVKRLTMEQISKSQEKLDVPESIEESKQKEENLDQPALGQSMNAA